MSFLRQNIYYVLIFLAVFGLFSNSMSFAEESFLEVGVADNIDNKIYKILKQEYGSEVAIISVAKDDHIVRLNFSYEKQLVDNIVLINTIDRVLVQDGEKLIANVVQIRFFPKLSPLDSLQEMPFFSAVMDWQYNKVVPQLVYLTAEKEIAYGWDIPVYKDDPVLGKTIISIVNDLSSAWQELYMFLSSHVNFDAKRQIVAQVDEQTNAAVHFLPKDEGLTKEGALVFKDFCQKAKENSGRIIIKGYVSSNNDTEENIQISLNRANQIKQMMVKEGIEISRIKSIGKGIKDPIADNNTREGRNMNRRAELVLIHQ